MAPGGNDYYAILGVARDADLASIKRAYRRLARENHPDRNPGDPAAEERFKAAAEAYAVLSDPDKRSRYDRFGQAGLGGQPFQGFDQDIFADFSDILGDLFGFGGGFAGGRRRRGRGLQGQDLLFELEIDLEEAARGLESAIRVPRQETCGPCNGSGAQGDAGSEVCADCGGRGQVAFQQGFFTIARTCARCAGAGRVIVTPCPACAGQGRVRNEAELTVRIPAGVDSGVRLRIPGEGEAGPRGGPPGDLYVAIRVREHPQLGRDGDDLLYRTTVSFPRAALGTRVEVPTLDGPYKLDVPAGTQPGTVFVLRGRGVPSLQGGPRGHLRATVDVSVPQRLGGERRELLERLAELDEEAAEEEPGLFERVKNIFH